ncbi:Multidrug resistance protein NorM [Bradyrhizobium ivorense]|uniref:Multidrug resistance protein NorM n=2 Tax=Bradyrhizobium ivorense TaxID=2511166 RepID=A0A508T8Y9_9BRAD|nr:Multidrug resistance protein NorM [Bradyrhizobium ivorense]
MDKITEMAATSRNLATRKGGSQLAGELSETAKLALPMVLTQVGQIAMMTTDVAFIGHIGAEALAGTALASRIYLGSFTAGLGLLASIAPLTAQAFGAGNLAVVRRSLCTGLWLAMLVSLPIIAFALHGEQMLLVLGQAPVTARLAQRYLFGLVWGVAPALCFQVIRISMGAVNRPEPVLWITAAAIPVNAVLVYVLINGKLGVPRLELFGAGLATSLVNCGMFFSSLWFVRVRRPFRDYHLFTNTLSFDWPLMRQLIIVGGPISIASLIGFGATSAAALLAGLVSTTALAAHQIALQVAVILFLISFGISMATAVRVGHAIGRDDGFAVKRAGLTALLLGVATIAVLALAVTVVRFEIAKLFIADSAGNTEATIGLAAKLLLIAAVFSISDAAQSIAAGGLRGLKDTRVPLLLAGVSHGLIGFCLGYVLGLKLSLGVIGVWIGLSTGTAVYAVLLIVRFLKLANMLVRKR